MTMASITFGKVPMATALLLSIGTAALAEDKVKSIRGFVYPHKASNVRMEEKFRAIAKQEIAEKGRVPYPAEYKVAYTDKNPLRGQILKVQTPVYGAEAITLIKENPQIIIIDLRMPIEYEDEHIPGAINVPFVQPNAGFVRSLAQLDSAKMTLIYCDMGKNTSKARLGFGGFNFKKLYAMRDGIRGWLAAGGRTVGPKKGPSHALDAIPPLVDLKLEPTPQAKSARDVSDGPFMPIPVSNDFAFTTDFAFDGHGYVTSGIITFLIRKRADVVANPFRIIPDARYPREHIKDLTGTRVFDADGTCREHVRYRADGTILRPKRGVRGYPSYVKYIRPFETKDEHAAREERKRNKGLSEEEAKKLRIAKMHWADYGIVGIHTDIYNNIWCTCLKGRTTKKESSLGLITGDESFLVLLEGGELETPYNLVHDAQRSLLFYCEPLKNQVWVLPVDRYGKNIGKPKTIIQMEDSEPWALALDEFGNLYVSAEPNVLRYETDNEGNVVGRGVKLNKEPIERAHAIHFGHGPGFSDTSLYVISTPRIWKIVADPLTGYVTGSYREDGSVTRQLENVRGFMSEFVRLDLGVRGAPETMVKAKQIAPDPYPDGTVEKIEDKRKKSAF